MKLCSIEGCERKHYQHGYCFMHFGRILRGCLDMRPGKIIDMPKRPFKSCSVDGCNGKHFARGYCRNHHARFLRKGTPYKKYLSPNCKVPGCEKPRSALGYCSFHYERFKNGIPLNAERYETHRGVNNENWKGGVAEYPNHSLMKRVRKQILKERGEFCQICRLPANKIHHLDKTKSNHDPSNIIIVCQRCHFRWFHKVGRPIKPISPIAHGRSRAATAEEGIGLGASPLDKLGSQPSYG